MPGHHSGITLTFSAFPSKRKYLSASADLDRHVSLATNTMSVACSESTGTVFLISGTDSPTKSFGGFSPLVCT